MGLFNDNEQAAGEAIAALSFTNPFLPERIKLEKIILREAYLEQGDVWSVDPANGNSRRNLEEIRKRAAELAGELCGRLREKSVKATAAEFDIYENIVIYYLFDKYRQPMLNFILDESGRLNCGFFRDFDAEFKHYLNIPGQNAAAKFSAVKVFEMYFQVHRAFHFIFEFLIGSSMASARLRAAIWQSIFTHDIYRYHRSLYDRMRNITTLITGPSGTGKELVARAIAYSQYIPFNQEKVEFATDFRNLFLPLHLSAMPHTLIESELFGHRKGAYTGALEDRAGWMEACSSYGTVFLDEIGEINEEIQVKLLRLLQNRKFQRLGETTDRTFNGKILAATNRCLPEAIRLGKFRPDLYYRLCADIIETPPLREQLSGSEQELSSLTHFLALRLIGPEEAGILAGESVSWIKQHLGMDYAWPGNVRELEQCIRNILIRGSYAPLDTGLQTGSKGGLREELRNCGMTAEELLNLYCSEVYAKTGSYLKTSVALGIDRRTVRKRIDAAEPR